MSETVENPPLVSIIIPCFKQAHYLNQSAGSALAQTHPNVEVIVIDDESPDNTPQVAAGFGDKIRYLRQTNAGVAGARNTGLGLARGEFVHFLDADDFLFPHMVETHLRAMQTSHAAVTASGWQLVSATGELLKSHEAPEFQPDAFHALLPYNLAPPVCFLFRRSAVDAARGFDPDRGLNGHEDWDLLLRIANAGGRFATVPQELCAYRDSPGSSSKQMRRMYNTGMAVLAKTENAHRKCANCGQRFAEARDRLADVCINAWLHPKETAAQKREKTAFQLKRSDVEFYLRVVRRVITRSLAQARNGRVLHWSAHMLRRVGIK